ncbi:MAG: hypothetical protein AB7L92_04480 [Alphaproteobacteria bacterium]
MKWLNDFFARLFGKKKEDKVWEEASYGKPSTAGDDFRKQNEV